MRILGRLALATALLAPAGLITIQSASAVGGGFNCTGSSGTVALDNGLSLRTARVSTVTVTAPGLTCTGGQVTAGGLTARLRMDKAVECSGWVGLKNAGTGTATWTLPVQMGTTTMNLGFKVTATAGHVTSGTISGRVTGNQQVGSGKGISGTFSLNKGLKSTASGGDCTVTGKLKNFGITAINIKTVVLP